MNYLLKLFDAPLLEFSAEAEKSDPNIQIQWIDEANAYLLPLGFDRTNKGLERWLAERTIPKNRAYMQQFLAKCGLNANRPMAIIAASKALSLNDSYWVTQTGSADTFAKTNLYDNRFSQILAHIVFTGYGSRVKSTFVSSPEFTTNGALPKCWRRNSGVISLWKGGTTGAANTGNEPYSEFYAHQIAQTLGIDAVPYRLSRWKGQVCSVCDLFTSKEVSFVPAHKLVANGSFEAVRELCHTLGPAFEQALGHMAVLDAVTLNTDRHFGNFGVLVNSRTNQILGPAPLFDHGNALMPFAYGNDLDDLQSLGEYAKTLRPRTYDSFVDEARENLTPQLRKSLRGLFDFTFAKSRCSNLPDKRLRLLQDYVRGQAALILE